MRQMTLSGMTSNQFDVIHKYIENATHYKLHVSFTPYSKGKGTVVIRTLHDAKSQKVFEETVMKAVVRALCKCDKIIEDENETVLPYQIADKAKLDLRIRGSTED